MAQLCFNTFNRSAYHGVDPDLPGQIRAAADAGFTLFGPDVFSLDAWVESGNDVVELAAMLDERGMRCWEIAALNLSGPQSTRGASQLARYADVLRPEWILTNVGAPIDDDLCAAFDAVCTVLERSGCRPALEYMPFTPAPSVNDMRRLVDAVGADRAGILLDTWHHFRGPDGDEDLVALPLEYVAYVQFDDARPMVGSDLRDETLNRRAFPGEGELDLRTYCSIVRAKGFDGVVSVEVLDAAWRSGDQLEFARRAYESSARYWPIG